MVTEYSEPLAEWIGRGGMVTAGAVADLVRVPAGPSRGSTDNGAHRVPSAHAGQQVQDRQLGVVWNGPDTVRFAQIVGQRTQDMILLGCQLDEQGWAITGPFGATSEPGVWVAGNVSNPRAQVITAAGEGSASAIANNADLVDEEVRNAVADHETQSSQDGSDPF